MKKIYEKSEIIFVFLYFYIYILGIIFANAIMDQFDLGIVNIFKSFWLIFISCMLIVFLKKNGLFIYYGLCKAKVSSKRRLNYFPLILISSFNVLNGITFKYSFIDMVLMSVEMFLIAFQEEMIFRGFLFKAFKNHFGNKAILFTNTLFCLFHLLNFNENILLTFLQVIFAFLIGIMYSLIFCTSKSLVYCIVSHGFINFLSLFNETLFKTKTSILIYLFEFLIILIYDVYLYKSFYKSRVEN